MLVLNLTYRLIIQIIVLYYICVPVDNLGWRTLLRISSLLPQVKSLFRAIYAWVVFYKMQ